MQYACVYNETSRINLLQNKSKLVRNTTTTQSKYFGLLISERDLALGIAKQKKKDYSRVAEEV